jgi:hypothetical protein
MTAPPTPARSRSVTNTATDQVVSGTDTGHSHCSQHNHGIRPCVVDIDGNVETGDYTGTKTVADCYTVVEQVTDQAATDTNTTTGSDTATTTTTTGNDQTASYSTRTTATGTARVTETATNQVVSGTITMTSTDLSTTTESDVVSSTLVGNMLTGLHTHHDPARQFHVVEQAGLKRQQQHLGVGQDDHRRDRQPAHLQVPQTPTETYNATNTEVSNSGPPATLNTVATDTSSAIDTGNSFTGAETASESRTCSATLQGSRTDARGSYSSSQTLSESDASTDSRNAIIGSDAPSAKATVVTTGTGLGTSYSLSVIQPRPEFRAAITC